MQLKLVSSCNFQTVIMMKKISVVVPVFNEEKNVPILIERLKKTLIKTGLDFEIIFSLDPCPDRTEEVILAHRKDEPRIKLIKFSRRFGQPSATMAGLNGATGDAVVVIDADLQDPPELIEIFVQKWLEGNDVVFGQRRTREGETIIKKMVAYLGYWAINKITKIKIPRNTGDFRLMDRRVVNEVIRLKDLDGFLRGLVAYVGFKHVAVLYDRDSRLTGAGNYNQYFGSLTIGFNGIIGFSRYPLHLISIMGTLISVASFTIGLIYLFLKLINYNIIWGNPTQVILITFLSGVQLLSLGVIGEYLARMYEAVLARPSFIVDKSWGFDKKEGG